MNFAAQKLDIDLFRYVQHSLEQSTWGPKMDVRQTLLSQKYKKGTESNSGYSRHARPDVNICYLILNRVPVAPFTNMV